MAFRQDGSYGPRNAISGGGATWGALYIADYPHDYDNAAGGAELRADIAPTLDISGGKPIGYPLQASGDGRGASGLLIVTPQPLDR